MYLLIGCCCCCCCALDSCLTSRQQHRMLSHIECHAHPCIPVFRTLVVQLSSHQSVQAGGGYGTCIPAHLLADRLSVEPQPRLGTTWQNPGPTDKLTGRNLTTESEPCSISNSSVLCFAARAEQTYSGSDIYQSSSAKRTAIEAHDSPITACPLGALQGLLWLNSFCAIFDTPVSLFLPWKTVLISCLPVQASKKPFCRK